MNELLFLKFNSLVTTSLWLDTIAIILAKSFGYAVIILLLFYAWREKQIKNLFAVPLGAAILARFIFVEILRFFYYNPRPFVVLQDIRSLIPHEDSASFPSGHATFFFALAMAVYLKNKMAGTILLCSAFIIGVARIYVGVHWPLDIIAGAVLGIAVAITFNKLSK